MAEILISEIDFRGRSRKNLGDITGLAESIEHLGLLHPIAVTKGKKLIAGRRRIAAFKHLGRESIPTNVINSLDDVQALLESERDENTCREGYTPEEAVHLGRRLEKIIMPLVEKAKAEGRKRGGETGGKGRPKDSSTQTLSKAIQDKNARSASRQIAASVGMSGTTYEKAKAVVDSGDSELIEKMNDTGKVNGASRKLIAKQRAAAEQEAARQNGKTEQWTITQNQQPVACSALITDPPYGILDQPWEPDDLETFTREWIDRWKSCGADSILVFWSQRHLWDGRRWFDESLSGYEFQQLLVWHYKNNKSPQSRMGFKQTWEPIFFYRRAGSERKVGVSGLEWGDDLHDFDCHVAAVPQSNFNDAEAKQHPAQKPVSVMRWLINATTSPGELVADPFAGSGTTGIAAVQLGRRFHGIETDKGYAKIARGRIASYGKVV